MTLIVKIFDDKKYSLNADTEQKLAAYQERT